MTVRSCSLQEMGTAYSKESPRTTRSVQAGSRGDPAGEEDHEEPEEERKDSKKRSFGRVLIGKLVFIIVCAILPID